ncbi:MAG TPA: GIY-YIG nuclease family protein [Patescibacteria group bacterium]|nr:GIY-YIG nuclease family protein [Patescibacteria group bacterium]
MYFAYVLENEQGNHYTGNTDNTEERLEMHNDISPGKARFHRTTYKKGPWKIIFVKEFLTRKDAMEFEKFLKTSSGRRWLKDNVKKK